MMLALMSPTKEDAKFVQTFKILTLDNGLVLDRESDPTTVSCAGTGLVAYSKALLVSDGCLDKIETSDEIKKGFFNTLKANPEKNRGWLCHFTNPCGEPKLWSEVSTVDSAIFYLGHLKAAQTLQDDEFEKQVKDAVSKIDIGFMKEGEYFRHGLRWILEEPKYLEAEGKPLLWDDYDEGIMIYDLFGLSLKSKTEFDVSLPMFVYYYPLCFKRHDNYIEMLKKAVKHQKDKYGYIGLTACDGPLGYQIAQDPTIISPLSIFAASMFSEVAKKEMASVRHCKLTPSYSVTTNWVSADRLAIDFASTYIITHLYR